MQLRRNSSVPLYRQVRDVLAEQIQRGALSPGQRLPSEAQLAADLRINRLTVRRAVEALTREGLVFTRRGAGSFVTEERPLTPLTLSLSPGDEWASLAEELAGGERYREILVASADDDEPGIRGDLAIPRGKITRLETAFEVGGMTRMLSTLWVPWRVGRKMQQTWREQPTGDYAVLRNEFGESLYALWRSFSAEAASVEDAHLLDVKPGSPLLVREGVTVDRFGTPVLRARRRVRGDRISYRLRYNPKLDQPPLTRQKDGQSEFSDGAGQ
jgi:GntR family transcriptional regulator